MSYFTNCEGFKCFCLMQGSRYHYRFRYASPHRCLVTSPFNVERPLFSETLGFLQQKSTFLYRLELSTLAIDCSLCCLIWFSFTLLL